MNPNVWEESTGLLSSLIPQTAGSAQLSNPQAFNASSGPLKLGPAPISEELRQETQRYLQETDIDISPQYGMHYARPAPVPGVISPTEADLPPHPPTFKVMDIKREVEKVRDARKRIRLEPVTLSGVDLHGNSAQAGAARGKSLPSICAYTLHDVPEGSVAQCRYFKTVQNDLLV